MPYPTPAALTKPFTTPLLAGDFDGRQTRWAASSDKRSSASASALTAQPTGPPTFAKP